MTSSRLLVGVCVVGLCSCLALRALADEETDKAMARQKRVEAAAKRSEAGKAGKPTPVLQSPEERQKKVEARAKAKGQSPIQAVSKDDPMDRMKRARAKAEASRAKREKARKDAEAKASVPAARTERKMPEKPDPKAGVDERKIGHPTDLHRQNPKDGVDDRTPGPMPARN